ncbi:MAG: protein phosphatase 2C domain-containing protein [Pseudomonadota bacterium]
MLKGGFRIESEGDSDTGRVRELNEDSLLMAPEVGLWVVADGMGGHDSGDFASQSVTEALGTIPIAQSAPDLLDAIEAKVIESNTLLRKMAADRGPGAVIGCTLAALVIFEDAYACVWSGDSRVYRLRQGLLEQISRDHTEAQELVDRGTLTPEEARTWPRRNVITRAIGVFDEPELEMVQGRVEHGDVFVICSDGLTEHVEDHEIERMAQRRPLYRVVDGLISTTLERGAKDNVTVIAVSCSGVTALQPGPVTVNRGIG